MQNNSLERRKYLRLETNVGLRVISGNSVLEHVSIHNMSPLGIRFSSGERLAAGARLEMSIVLPAATNPIHINSKVIWQNDENDKGKMFDTGCEFVNIEEDNKNTFLKFLCDVIYSKSVSVKKGEQI